jgi:hypothetical protein
MTPNTRAIVADLAARMGSVYAPDLKSPYLAGSAGLTAAVLTMVAEEGDRTAHRLVEENRAIRAIFADAAALSLGGALAEQLTTLAAGDDADLRVSALQAQNDALRRALVDLHAFVEGETGEAARAIDAAIWRELSASTGRRAFPSMRF